MRRSCRRNRERFVCKLSSGDCWFEYGRLKKYLSSQRGEAEVKSLVNDLKI
jgi:hypothetical protein